MRPLLQRRWVSGHVDWRMAVLGGVSKTDEKGGGEAVKVVRLR
jgi:hypothetical protein